MLVQLFCIIHFKSCQKHLFLPSLHQNHTMISQYAQASLAIVHLGGQSAEAMFPKEKDEILSF